MKLRLLFFSLMLGIFSCQNPKIDLGLATKFFPNAKLLHQGVASKYYEHHIPHNNNATSSTNIVYRTYQFSPPNLLEIKSFDAAYRMQWKTVYECDEHQFKIKEKHFVFKSDTIQATITNPLATNWQNDEADSDFNFSFHDGYQMFYNNRQASIKDTLLENRPSKKIERNINFVVVSPEGDSTKYNNRQEDFYAEGLGIFASIFHTSDMATHSELVEQMSLQEFEKRANHGKKRIAYIDPSNTLDDNPNFKICNPEVQIGDYYNCSPPGQIVGGKGTWWRILEKELQPEKLKNESGYLTFRFVMNCKGEVGRFITEESSLDFEKKKFDKTTVNHLYEIIAKQTNWQVCETRQNGIQDAYTYLTFKLKDGKIIEILP